MGKFIDLTGQRFGRLVVIERADDYMAKTNNRTISTWLCLCDCGKKVIAKSVYLKKGDTKSCGCLRLEMSHNKMQNKILPKYQDKLFQGTNIYLLNNNIRSNNISGTRGVSYITSVCKWQATIGLHGKNINLGRYIRKEDAIKARQTAEEELFQPIIEEYNRQKEE